MATSPSPTSTPRAQRPAWLVIVLCWTLVVFDGYDLIVYGTTIPSLLHEPGWNLTPATAGFVGSLAFVGMLIGALAAGQLADRLGRRTTILWMTAGFSVFTALCFFAPNRELFGLFRLLAGIGLGGLVPSANALTAEFVSSKHRSAVATIMMSGVPIGGSAAALLGLWLIPIFGWREMYLIALLAFVVVLPLCFFFMPESPSWLRAHGHVEKAERIEAMYGRPPQLPSAVDHGVGIGAVFTRKWRLTTTLFAVATIACLFAWYGLGTWLPGIMKSDPRFDMGAPLTFLLALNIGAVIGSFVTAWGGVKFGPIQSGVFSAAVAGGALAFLLTFPSTLPPIYAALILAGVGTHGTQCLIIAAVANHYPAALRGTGLGVALGLGRIGAVAAPQVAGWFIAAGLGVGSTFLLFSGAALLTAVLLLIAYFIPHPDPSVHSEHAEVPLAH